jgi:imidazoleglycerol-phosphate dehydratase
MAKIVKKSRETKETDINITLNIYGTGESEIDTGIGFFNHMLESFSKHSLIDLEVVCRGDLHIDGHHSVEDIGIVLGSALREAIYPVKDIERFGSGFAVMDESLIECHIDLSNRAFLFYDINIDGKVGDFDVELVEEFFRAVTFNMPLTMHIFMQRGKNRHHIIEATFKAFALALRKALTPNSRVGVPSTKGVL